MFSRFPRLRFVTGALLVGLLLSVLSNSGDVAAQLGLAHTSVSPGQTITAAMWNGNFVATSQKALNREGGTLTGHLLASPDNTIDIGASSATRPRNLYLGSNAAIGGTLGVSGASTLAGLSATTGSFSSTLAVTGAATLTSTLAVNSTSAAAIDVAGGITAGSGNVAIIDTTGKIPAISSTNFASLSGANLTGLLEANIADGSVFPRLAATETVSGAWAFSTGPILNNTVFMQSRNSSAAAADAVGTDLSGNMFFGISDANVDAGFGTPVFLRGSSLSFRANKTTWTTLSATGILTHTGALAVSGEISPATLSSGDTNDYNPTGLSGAFALYLTAATGGSSLTGLQGGVAGRMVMICNESGVSGDDLTIPIESGSSTAGNRFMNGVTLSGEKKGCALAVYKGSASRWRIVVTGL